MFPAKKNISQEKKKSPKTKISSNGNTNILIVSSIKLYTFLGADTKIDTFFFLVEKLLICENSFGYTTKTVEREIS